MINNILNIYNQIKKYTFKCSLCGSCCRYSSNYNNIVYIRYDEIITIESNYNIKMLSFIDPFFPDFIKYRNSKNYPFNIKKYLKSIKDQIDENGYIHIFGWKLKRTSNGNCIFYNSTNRTCNIYKYRPSICSTYPFYLNIETNELSICCCNQIHKNNSIILDNKHEIYMNKEFMKLIFRLNKDKKDLQLIKESIINSNFNNLSFNSREYLLKAYKHFLNGHIIFIVYDAVKRYKIKIFIAQEIK